MSQDNNSNHNSSNHSSSNHENSSHENLSAKDQGQRAEAYGLLVQLHDMIDRLVAPFLEMHEPRLQCKRGCSGCCVDDLSVFDVEAERIRRTHPALLAQGTPHAPGACAFLDEQGACRIYEVRPYVCRTQGLPLRWLEQEASEVVEYRDICPLNIVEGQPISLLEPEACWPIGPVEQKLSAFQEAFGHGQMQRVSLRALFGCAIDSNTAEIELV